MEGRQKNTMREGEPGKGRVEERKVSIIVALMRGEKKGRKTPRQKEKSAISVHCADLTLAPSSRSNRLRIGYSARAGSRGPDQSQSLFHQSPALTEGL
jgi:hypothetical protein